MGSRLPEIHIDESVVRFSDGPAINLADIKEVRAPNVVVGIPNHPITTTIASYVGQGYGVVYILYVTSQGPASKVIPTVDLAAASALAKRLQEAIAVAKKMKTTSKRVVVGECVHCHRQLRVRAHAVRPQMTLTCKCGQKNKLNTTVDLSDE